MKNLYIIIGLLFSFQLLAAQELTGKELLEKTINYHDPNQN
jgi:hypothetical protein